MLQRRAVLGAALALPALAGAARAQTDYPDHAIRIIVGFAPGGATDITTRLLAPRLQTALGGIAPVVVENKPGGSGNVATQAVVNAAPDGYTLLMGTISALAINPSLFSDLPFNPQADLTPIGLFADVLNILVVPADRPWKSLPELIAAARARPGALNYSSSGIGGAGHLGGALLDHLAGIQTVHIPYRGGGPAMTDLVSGKVDFSFATAPTALPLIEAGKIRALAVPTARRSTLLPDVPAVAETVPSFEVANWYAMLGPKDLPKPIVTRLSAALQECLREPALASDLAQHGAEARPSTPEELAAFLRSETEKWRPILKSSGAKAE
ncbi:Bug family tripartite tricarboxylate transporter substrate binding protein [Teichococcus coralli]|nr:tripartite tricarboxylate transporter substrate binding protein [Pseudoroseomonas coralli]